MVPLAAVDCLVPRAALEEALAAAGLLSTDGHHAVDPVPHGLDWGLGRILAGANRPISVEHLAKGLHRWARDRSGQVGPGAAWLARYLECSPLYENRGTGWLARGSWPRPSRTDLLLASVVVEAGGNASTSELTAALIKHGLMSRPKTATHAVTVSPVLVQLARGRFGLVQTQNKR